LNISNRSLVLLLIVTLILVGGAAALTVTLSMKDAAGAPVVVASADVQVVPEVVRKEGKPIDPKGPLLVAVPKGQKYDSATLKCDMFVAERPFYEGGMAFESIPFGDCQVLLVGSTKGYGPVYPGDRLECTVTDGTTTCSGGIAADKAGTVTITSVAGGTLTVDGKDEGALPAEVKLRVGKRAVVVTLPDGRKMSWNLVVQPEEVISVAFPAPPGWTAAPSVGSAFAPTVVPAAPEAAAAQATASTEPAAAPAPAAETPPAPPAQPQ
jgi:hypothetical protein